MLTPITANYVPDGDDWKVSVTRDDHTLTGRAPGLIAARDTADQLVEKLTPKGDDNTADASGATVVHLLEGDPVAFSTAYLHARHGGLAGAPTEQSGVDGQQPDSAGSGTGSGVDTSEDSGAAGASGEVPVEAEVPAQPSETPSDATPSDATPSDATPSDATPSDATPSSETSPGATPSGGTSSEEQAADNAKDGAAVPASQSMGSPLPGAKAPVEDNAPPAHAHGG